VLAAGVLSCCACVTVLALVGWSEFPTPGVRVALVAVPAGLVVYGAIGVEVVRGRIVSPFVQHLGDASYSLFLTHVPALTLVVVLLGGRLPATTWVHAFMLPGAFIFVVVGAFVCHAVLERPMQDAVKRLLGSAERRDRRVAVAE
jgi:peptidoglycan/LPS O-acetylase OafA/YrhL